MSDIADYYLWRLHNQACVLHICKKYVKSRVVKGYI